MSLDSTVKNKPQLTAKKRHNKVYRRKRDQKTLILLVKHFPAIFDKKHVLPLMINVHQKVVDELSSRELLDESLSENRIKQAIAYWCNREQYYKATLYHKCRYNLLGEQVEKIDKESLLNAQRKLRELKRRKIQQKVG